MNLLMFIDQKQDKKSLLQAKIKQKVKFFKESDEFKHLSSLQQNLISVSCGLLDKRYEELGYPKYRDIRCELTFHVDYTKKIGIVREFYLIYRFIP